MYLAAFLLQPFLQNLIPSIGENLNLILCFSVMLIFVGEDPVPGIVFGSIFSLLNDLFYGLYAGPGALSLALCGMIVYGLKYFAHVENFLNAIIFMAGSTVLYITFYWGIYAAIGTTYSYGYALSHSLLQIVFNSIVGLGIYLVLIEKEKKRRRDRYYR